MHELTTLLTTEQRVRTLIQQSSQSALTLAETVHTYERTERTQHMLDEARRRYARLQ